MKKNFKNHRSNGFTLIESLVSLFIFVLLAGVVYSTSTALIRQSRYYREYTTISGLADRYLEIARNIPYSQIGTKNGNPNGPLPDLPNATTTIANNSTYKIYYAVSYVDDPADGTIIAGTDAAPNDYKQIKLYITNATTSIKTSFLTNMVPKGLENLNSGGALSIKVFDAVGQGVPNATLNITNTAISPQINLTREADSSGNWIEVGLPVSANNYHIVASRTGYSTDQTYPITVLNPNPTKPDATISNGQVTQVSFSIDKTSNLTFKTLNTTCGPIGNVGVGVQGAKLIGTPSVLKFNNIYTSDGTGNITLNNIEWDTYTPALTTGSLMLYGTSPIQQIDLLPNTTQQFNLILGTKTTNSLLVTVKDAGTNTALDSATIELEKASQATSSIKLTGGSNLSQQLWSGGGGQDVFADTTKYYADDGHISINGSPSGLRLFFNGSTYNTSGTLTSSTFDTGTASTSYTNINWQPTSQTASTTVKFQIATNNDNATWNYLGPDATSNTFYTVPGAAINIVHKNNRYLRYKIFLDTIDDSQTPVLTSMNINYVAGCFTPGQVMFESLATGSDYQIIISMPGYVAQTIPNLNINGNNILQVLLNPQ